MFQIDTGDFKLMFEYDTEEELRFALEQAQRNSNTSPVTAFQGSQTTHRKL
jgi:hypothetical protein